MIDSLSSPLLEVLPVRTQAQIAAVQGLFRDYQQGLGIDLCFQGFEEELAQLPGLYAEPEGALLMALVNGQPAGCCALRPLAHSDHLDACEMKRLFVRPAFRGLGLGRRLVDAIVLAAEQAGYATMLLDTLSDMESARALYQEVGFVETEPYYHNPLAGAHYLMLDLRDLHTRGI